MDIWHHIGQEIVDFTTHIRSLPVSRLLRRKTFDKNWKRRSIWQYPFRCLS